MELEKILLDLKQETGADTIKISSPDSDGEWLIEADNSGWYFPLYAYGDTLMESITRLKAILTKRLKG